MHAKLSTIGKEKDQVRYRIDLVKSYRYLEYYRDHYNDQVTDKKHRLKNEFLLAKELIRLYRQEFMRWQESMGKVDIYFENLPLLAVNNQFLGRVMCKTDRTIQNYRKKLAEAGILVPVSHNEKEKAYSVFHGRTCDYELMLNPKLLHISSNLHTLRVQVYGVDDFFDITKKFRPTSTSTLTRTLTRTKPEPLAEKNANPIVDNLDGTKPEPHNQQPEPKGRNGQSNQPPVQVQQEPKIPAAPPAAEGLTQAGSNPEAEFRRKKTVQSYAKTLLNSARTYLYPNEHFDQARKEAVCRRIEALFGDAPEEKLLKILHNYQHRLKLAQLHWAKLYGALPEVESFFDKNNPNGFRATGEFEDDRDKYPPPRRSTYRLANQQRRGRGNAGRIGDILNH